MHRNRPEVLKSALCIRGKCLLLALVLTIPVQALSQTTADVKAERHRALQLYGQNKFADAIPILETLVAVSPSDIEPDSGADPTRLSDDELAELDRLSVESAGYDPNSDEWAGYTGPSD